MPARTQRFEQLQEQFQIGRRTQEWIKFDRPELRERDIESVGITRARVPYRMVRHCFRPGHILATVGGEGDLWHAGAWRRCKAGDVFINPPEQPEAFHALPGREWHFCWIHAEAPFFNAYSPGKARFLQADPRLFYLAIEGYLHAHQSAVGEAMAQPWADLVRTYAFQLVHAGQKKVRLWKLWEAVIQEPGRDWNVHNLARLAGLSREQLRHYSWRETGRAPMHHVAYLRVQRAIDILRTSDYKLESIAALVGFSNPFALSNAFYRILGKRPSAYRFKQARE
jgi:AraC-like DNA-binding protein